MGTLKFGISNYPDNRSPHNPVVHGFEPRELVGSITLAFAAIIVRSHLKSRISIRQVGVVEAKSASADIGA